MNAARRVARAGRTLLIALLAGGVIIIAIVVAYVVGRSASPEAAAPPQATANGDSDANGSSTGDSAPGGCLGGEAQGNKMLLDAQEDAPHTSFGAVDMAAAFMRWAYRRPYPTDRDIRVIGAEIVSPDASPGFRDIGSSYQNATDITRGVVPGETPFSLSLANGAWLVRQESTVDRVTVDLTANYVIDGVLSPTKTAAISATFVWQQGSWRLLSEQPPDVDALSAGGTQFVAGC